MLELAYLTLKITLCKAVLRIYPDSHFRQLASSLAADVINFLEMLRVGRLSAFWWAGEFIYTIPMFAVF